MIPFGFWLSAITAGIRLLGSVADEVGLRRSWERELNSAGMEGEILRRDRFVDFIETVNYPSPRFVAQKGIFTKALNGDDIETNVKRWLNQRPNDELFVKFKIPGKDREKCLRALDLMNIDYRSLLLDIRDVVDRCNP